MMKLTIDGYPNKKNNKYLKWYRNIIFSRLENPKQEYFEKHHILPRCLGGDNKNNIVNLSAREHFIVHYLLTKFITGKGRYKIILAFGALSNLKGNNRKEQHVNSRLYESMKLELSDACSTRSKRMWENDEFRLKIIQGQKKSWKGEKRDKHREWMKDNSPLKNKEIHDKTMQTRKARGTNIWSTNNPMKDKDFALKVAAKRSGKNHYTKKNVSYFYRYSDEEEWKVIPKGSLHSFRNENGLTRSKMEKLLEGKDIGTSLQMKKVEYENKKDN